MINTLQVSVQNRPVLRSMLTAAMWLLITYIVVLWGCFCYVRLPISPYGFWDVVGWLVLASAIVWSSVAVFLGAAQLFLFLGIIILVVVSFTLSLVCLGWIVVRSLRTQDPWIKRYRSTLIMGIVAVLALATFVEGSYRFWDKPFNALNWAMLALLAASAWAALFCHLAKDNVSDSRTSRRIAKWTVGLTFAIGVFAYWHQRSDGPEYFLRKSVIEHPNDSSAWLDLAWHYKFEGDTVENSDDEDHGPSDPTPYYSEALDCINRAMALGATGFDVHFSRAELADAVGKQHEALSSAQAALGIAPSNSEPDEEDRVNRLREIIARNSVPSKPGDEDRRQRVRDRRRESLPRIVRWVFDFV